MNRDVDNELAAWVADWRGEENPPSAAVREAIRHQVRRRSRGLALMAAGEVLLTAAALGFLARVALTATLRVDAAVMAGLALLAVAALAFSLWNRRGLWKAGADTTAAHLALSLARARRRRRGLRAGWVLLALEVAVFVPWIWLHRATAAGGIPEPLSLVRAFGFLAAWAGGAAVILAAVSRWSRRDLARLEALRRALSD